ncbi:MAG: hypothetical protein RPR28_06600 [Cycloclasticus sp.]
MTEEENEGQFWAALSAGDAGLVIKLIGVGVDTQFEDAYGPYVHQILHKCLKSNDGKWIKVLGALINNGVDLSVRDHDGFSLMEYILESQNPKLLALVGLDKARLAETAEEYVKPLPVLPYELFDVRIEGAQARDVIDALMGGYYGWQETKLIRIVNLAFAVLEELYDGDDSVFDEHGEILERIGEAQINAFLCRDVSDVRAYEREFEQFISSLEKQGKLDGPDISLIRELDRIAARIKTAKAGLELA